MNPPYYNLGALFAGCARTNADRAALRQLDGEVSYSELADLVAEMEHELRGAGIRRGDVVAIVHNKHRLSYAAMLACLAIGAPYVCLDSASPPQRNRMILERSAAAMLLLEPGGEDNPLSSVASELGVRCQVEGVRRDGRAAQHRYDTDQEVDGESIAYIMFTSGSTGEPKGVAVTHQNVLSFLAWSGSRFKVVPDDNFANVSPMYFDNSVFDFYTALFSGASLSTVTRELLQKPYELVPFLERNNCTIWFSVPSLLIFMMTMKAFTAESLPMLRTIIFGGEGYPKKELQRLHKLFSGRAELVNVYGPTECTCICSAYTIGSHDFETLEGIPPLGRLNPNFDYAVLDADSGEESDFGELCLMGPNVAAGYFRDPERTAQSFFRWSAPDRFMKHAYRTGDLVRQEGGMLHFSGRVDNQIKHLGYRIELEEIEAALSSFPSVTQAAAVYRRESSSHGKIVAYVAGQPNLDVSELLSHTRSHLPSYMIPSTVHVMEHLPKNANGKVDRTALTEMP